MAETLICSCCCG